MAKIEDLKKSILLMNEDELLELILTRREERITPKKNPKLGSTSKSPRKKSTPKKLDHFAIAKTLPADKAQSLLDKLLAKAKPIKQETLDGL